MADHHESDLAPNARVTIERPDGVIQIVGPPEKRVTARPGHRRFQLHRHEDVTGVSGTGMIAEGVSFSDGTSVLRWVCGLRSTAVYDNLEDLVAIHGHDGKTELIWADD